MNLSLRFEVLRKSIDHTTVQIEERSMQLSAEPHCRQHVPISVQITLRPAGAHWKSNGVFRHDATDRYAEHKCAERNRVVTIAKQPGRDVGPLTYSDKLCRYQ